MGDHYCCIRCNQRYERCTCYNEIKSVGQKFTEQHALELLDAAERAAVKRREMEEQKVNWGSPPPKIALQVDLGTGDIIDIHKVVGVKTDIPTLFVIEKMKDGGNRLTFNQVRIPDLTKVAGLKFIRQTDT